MIDAKLHAKLIEKWKKCGKGVYQTPKRIGERLPFFCSFVGTFKDKDVLELGCNAGVYGYEIAKVARSYIGVDSGDYYIEQAKITQKHIENPNVTFLCSTVHDYIKTEPANNVNALFVSFALYHFSDQEIDELFYHVLPKCDVVIIQTRTAKRSPFRPYNKWKFWKPSRVEKWLTAAGFKCETYWGAKKVFADIIGRRECESQTVPGNIETVEAQEGVSDVAQSEQVPADTGATV